MNDSERIMPSQNKSFTIKKKKKKTLILTKTVQLQQSVVKSLRTNLNVNIHETHVNESMQR